MDCYSTTYLRPAGRTPFLSCPWLAVLRGTLRGRVPPAARPPRSMVFLPRARTPAHACSGRRPELEAAQNGAVEVLLAYGSVGTLPFPSPHIPASRAACRTAPSKR